MAYTDVRDEIIAAAGVTSAHNTIVTAAITRAAKWLLRNYNFPESLTYVAKPDSPDYLTEDEYTVTLPSSCGKIKGVRLARVDITDSSFLDYMVIRRKEETYIDETTGSQLWYTRVGDTLSLSKPMDNDYYKLQLWYQTVSTSAMETALSGTYGDVLFHLGMLRAAPTLHKPELIGVYAPLWQQDQDTLARYLNEIEWENMDFAAGDSLPITLTERYPAGD